MRPAATNCSPSKGTRNGHVCELRPDEKQIVTASWDKTAIVWDAVSGEKIRTLQGHTNVNFASYSPDGSELPRRLTTRQRSLGCASGEKLHTLQRHTSRVNSANYSPDGKRIVTTSDDKTGSSGMCERRSTPHSPGACTRRPFCEFQSRRQPHCHDISNGSVIMWMPLVAKNSALFRGIRARFVLLVTVRTANGSSR